MLIHHDHTGKVLWYNLFISEGMEQNCLSENTIWLEGQTLPPTPTSIPVGYVPYLTYQTETGLSYDFEPEISPEPTEIEILMQALADGEIRDFEIQQGQELLAQQLADIELMILGGGV